MDPDEEFANDEDNCRICGKEYNEKTKTKPCDFCCKASCLECCKALRRFPQQLILEDSKDEPPRGQCCKICVRKINMKHFYDAFLADVGGDSFKKKEMKLQKRHDDLRNKFEELSKIQAENKSLSKKQSKIEE